MKDRDLLILKAQELLVKQGLLPSGRKPRSDKGKARAKQTHKYKQDAVWKYKMVMTKLLNKDDDYLLLTDHNGYYCKIPEVLKPEYDSYKDGRSVKYKRIQKEIDLEEYRFNAWQQMAISQKIANLLVPLPNRDLTRWALDCGKMNPRQSYDYFVKKGFTYKTLFLTFYHIEDGDQEYWSYAQWRKYYDRIPKIELDESFKLKLDHPPGSLDFHPEWSWYTKQLEDEAKQIELEARERRSWTAKISKIKGDK